MSQAALQQKLRAAYDAFNRDPGLKALEQRAMANLEDRARVDAFLKRMPLSPLEYLQMDMEVRHYEFMIPRYIQELHIRWMEIHEPLARLMYGDDHVNQVLTRWPADTGSEILGEFEAATVGTNRNAASTDSPAPNAYDGEIQIAVNHLNNNQMVAAANTWGNAGAACNNEQTQSVFYSSNGGTTWDYTCAPSNNVFALGTCTGTVFGSDPALYWNDNNEVFLNYMLLCSSGSSTKYAMVVARSANGGATWVNQGVIKNAWATGTLEDKNFYVIDNNAASPFYGRHYTCWDRANNEKFAYSSNNGATWTEVDLPTAPIGGIDLGCEIAVQKNGTVHVVWDSLTCSATCSDERMWYTRSTNGGVSWSSPVQVRDFNLVGFSGANKPPVADQRGIGPFGAVDVDNSGGACDGILYATFSDWTSGGATENDVWISRSTNGGTTWGAPVKINDDGLANRTQFHPFLQVDQSNGSVVVVWHDARNDANNRRVDYYAARSTNCGVSFEANVQASQASAEFNNSGISYTSENTTDNPNRNPNQYGEYMGLDVKNGKAYMAWVDSRHFYPGSSTNAQKENVGFAVIDFSPPSTPHFFENYLGWGDLDQCGYNFGGVFYGSQGVEPGTWTKPVRMDTDNRGGGCTQQFGLYDPSGRLSGLLLKVNFHGAANQCGGQGIRTVPISSIYSSNWSTWSPSYAIDTDDDSGYCTQTFSIEGRSDVALDVSFEAEVNNGQCGNVGTFPVVWGRSATFRIDTDGRSGGCRQKFRLRLNADADSDGVGDAIDVCPYTYGSGSNGCPPICGNWSCESGENSYSCPFDCGFCGDSVCGAGEDSFNCPGDCGGGGGTCGNGTCEPMQGECDSSCPQDCSGVLCL